MRMRGGFTGLTHPVWSTPLDYSSPENRRAFVEFATGRSKNPRYRPALEKQVEEMMIIAEDRNRQAAHPLGRDAARHSRHLGE
jgi:hypothetical protein